MKWNCFDWFDHYAAEKNGVPKLETQPIHTDAIRKRVQEQAGIAPQPKRNRMHMTKWVAGIAVAAVLVTGGTTLVAAAGYGGLDAFFQRPDRRRNTERSGKAGGSGHYASSGLRQHQRECTV